MQKKSGLSFYVQKYGSLFLPWYRKKKIVTTFYNSDVFLTVVTVSKCALFLELQVYISQFRLYMHGKKSQLPFLIKFFNLIY